MKRLSSDSVVDMYQSHQQRYHSYAMARPSLKKSDSVDSESELARSLSTAFYSTSYQADIARYAGQFTILLY